MNECKCSYKAILDIFKVSRTKSYLLCKNCNGIIATWEDMIPIRDFTEEEREELK